MPLAILTPIQGDVRFESKADICSAQADVRFVPIADITPLFDDLVSSSEQRLWNVEAQSLRGFEIDDQLKFVRRLHRQVTRFLALENAIDISRGATDRLVRIRP
jgi:hypothetical protein